MSRVLRNRPVDVLASAESALAMAHNEIRHRARLVRDLAPVDTVMADEGRLSQVFLNLLVNAAHAIPEGDEGGHEIRVVLRQSAGRVQFEVHDTGVGIAPEVLPRIFDPFFTTKSVGAGTGLGLAICHTIVIALGGRIELESSPGHGTTARVTLTAATSELDETTEESSAERPAGKRGRILVVDDEPLLAKMIAAMLAPEHDVTCETSARAALARLRAGERFDAIVCDLMMPQITGMELYETLLDFAPAQAQSMLFLTGGAFTPRARAFLERLSGAVLDKPVESNTLTARVRGLVG
jgi:CheY-like chemotaxis protein